jgi:UDP-N-acetylglucosamine 2-epimerase
VKIFTVIGARPQFIKAAAVSGPLRRRATEILLHTGQHYDVSMSDRFFDELSLPEPDYHLEVGSASHGRQTGTMLAGIEAALETEQPDKVLVYGDTNSTLAGALAAAKLGIAVVHVEAGLRSFNRAMPEEINRVVADHLADCLCCPGDRAVSNLANEGITRGVHVTGDVMRDLLERARPALTDAVLDRMDVAPGKYLLLTLHRAENADEAVRLCRIVTTMAGVREPVIFPVHPRTREALAALGFSPSGSLRMMEPLGYADTLSLQRRARLVVTDSGGIQKEAYWLGVPCVTLREETEWTETVDAGWNRLAGSDPARIQQALEGWTAPPNRADLYGDGRAAERIADLITAE